MKLKNKKTGEITCGTKLEIVGKETIYLYNSLDDLNEEWEDYKEPKEFYFITESGEICSTMEFDDISLYKEIGNYFETREEAEKAVEKLKAWKRLKDKRFRFTGINDAEESQIMIYQCGILCEANIEHRLSKDEDFILLFGELINATQTNQR